MKELLTSGLSAERRKRRGGLKRCRQDIIYKKGLIYMSNKILSGTETEYGITSKKPESFDPVTASLFLINHLRPFSSLRILWDYENEDPLVDARRSEEHTSELQSLAYLV